MKYSTVTIIKRDTSKTYEVKSYSVENNVINLYFEDENGYTSQVIVPLFNVEEIEVDR